MEGGARTAPCAIGVFQERGVRMGIMPDKQRADECVKVVCLGRP